VAKKAKKTARKRRVASRKGKAKVADDVAPDPQPTRQFKIPPELVEYLLLGPADDRRVLQESPLLGDVWAAFAEDPGSIQDLLITPHKEATAAEVADKVSSSIVRKGERKGERAKVAYLQGLVGARMYFDEVLRILVPLTQWWYQPKIRDVVTKAGVEGLLRDAERLKELLTTAADMYKADLHKAVQTSVRWNFTSLERYIALAGLIYWIGRQPQPEKLQRVELKDACELFRPHIPEIVAGMFELYETVKADTHALRAENSDDPDADAFDGSNGYIFQVSLNRHAVTALDRSVPAVKGDAARSLFKVNCSKIVWAVLDSGIDSTHDAFMTVDRRRTTDLDHPEYMSRVRKTFDFTNIRNIVSNDEQDIDAAGITELAEATGQKEAKVTEYLKTIAKDAKDRRPINWGVVEKLITLKPKQKPPKPANADAGAQAESGTGTPTAPEEPESDKPEPEKSQPVELEQLTSTHGTHVAGIIGADQFGYGNKTNTYAGGMCPDIRLYDFRVLGKTMEDTEFAIIAALQYIRYVNERHSYITIHGANLSLSIPHNVRNFACGRTPVCNECERLVESGVVVVAAAGNRGFQKFETKDGGVFESYAAFSITDPGNGDGVITVGSTHGNWPHTYGVSFFSSRGPTGDGRLKPDLVAPGERVQSTLPDGEWGPESGTSMATPHVSGAAAMLLARYEELIGQPRRVKRILCESATDLGRERSFQGHGMLDVLRAFQSI
jgi:subtilisin family serine protease